MKTYAMNPVRHLMRALTLSSGLLLSSWAQAAEFDGTQLSPLWGLPFAGILLSIAIMPLPGVSDNLATGWPLQRVILMTICSGS